MKVIGLLLAVMIATLGCNSPEPLVGKWKPSQRYDRFNQTWQPAKDEVYLEFLADGTFSGFAQGKLRRGTYKIDKTGSLHHLIMNDEKLGTLNGVFKVEGNTVTVKGYLDAEAGFPPSLEPGNNEPPFELVKLERQ